MRSWPMPCSAQVRVISPSAVTSMTMSSAATPRHGRDNHELAIVLVQVHGDRGRFGHRVPFSPGRPLTALRQLAGVLGGILGRDPRVRIPIVFHRHGLAGEVERMEGIDDITASSSVASLPTAGLDGARRAAVRDAGGVDR